MNQVLPQPTASSEVQLQLHPSSSRRLSPHKYSSNKQKTGNEKEEKRRELAVFSWRFMGVSLEFNQGPALSAINSSLFRYDSVIPDPVGVDWRMTPFVTPIQVQFDCASCWAMAAADTVAIANAIAANTTVIPASTQQICDCAGHQCCSGGWPENAYSYIVQRGSLGISPARDYNYWAADGRQCLATEGTPRGAASATGWERVPAFSQEALLKAVKMQPVLVYISASSPDFQRYSSPPPSDPRGVNVYDGNCSFEVNHAVVVVGYNMRQRYWVLKNTWPSDGWGDNGYMYIKMMDGPGKCGMLSVNPLYPINFPKAPNPVTVSPGATPMLSYRTANWWETWVAPQGSYNPCMGVINPCGNGTCFSDGGIARCNCPSPYVEVVGVPTSKCVHKSPCSTSLINPCGAGSCTDVGDGSYFCGCPTGYAIGFRVDGAPSCVPVNDVLARTYVAQYRDTCQLLQRLYTISPSSFATLNPYLDCSRPLIPGVLVTLLNSTGVACMQAYAIRPDDTCELLAYFINSNKFYRWLSGAQDLANIPSLSKSTPKRWSVSEQDMADLMALNPTLNCSSLMAAQQVCVSTISYDKSAGPVTCSQAYTAQLGDTCNSLRKSYGLKNREWNLLNPGFNCNSNGGRLSPGVQVCISQDSTTDPVVCSEFYTVQQGDTCAHIWNAANLSQYQFSFINPGLQCQTPYLYAGRQVCINSPSLVNISDPSYIPYLVQVNDTWGTVQAQFSRQCRPWSITVQRIADQNSIDDWVKYQFKLGTVLVIPCVPGIGATCGCVPSLPLCGADLVNYQSYCDAQCNFALPATNGACDTCATACQGRMGRLPSPTSACAEKYVCPWPTWPPPLANALQVFTTSPLCSYRFRSCLNVCAMYGLVFNVPGGIGSGCMNACTSCSRVPCSGPAEVVQSGSATCPAGCTNSPGCFFATRNFCGTDCSYWNSLWNPLNP